MTVTPNVQHILFLFGCANRCKMYSALTHTQAYLPRIKTR